MNQNINRYPADWAGRSRNTKLSRSKGNTVQCSCCGGWFDWDDVEVHHAYYLGEKDRAGVNIFPVCGSIRQSGTCHRWLHSRENWIVDRSNSRNNRNHDRIIERLRKGYTIETPIAPSVDSLWFWGGIAAAGFGFGTIFLNPSNTVTVKEFSNIRQTPNGLVLCEVKAGDRLKIAPPPGVSVQQARSRSWIPIEACGMKGLIFSKQVN